MQYQTITVDIAENTGVIALTRPEKMNSLNAQMRAELLHAVRQVCRQVRVLVLTGAGEAFCSGQDLGDRSNATSMDLERSLRDEYNPLLRAIADSPVPVMAAVNGPAVGAGANLALATDVVIAAESAYFMQAFTRIGLMPDSGGTWVMPRSMGYAKAMGACLFADRISARQAEQWGMIWEVVEDAHFASTWRARAAHLATGPTIAYEQIRKALRESWFHVYESHLDAEAKMQGRLGKTRDFQEGVVAFLQKRPSQFEGR